MKKVIHTAFVYFVFAMCSGVFYREFTRWHHYTEETVLSVLHTHSLTLGVALFLFIALAFKVTKLENNKWYQKFYLLYNLALPLMLLTMTVRGVTQVLRNTLSSGADAMLSGFSGLAHIGLAVALIFFFIALREEMLKD